MALYKENGEEGQSDLVEKNEVVAKTKVIFKEVFKTVEIVQKP